MLQIGGYVLWFHTAAMEPFNFIWKYNVWNCDLVKNISKVLSQWKKWDYSNQNQTELFKSNIISFVKVIDNKRSYNI